MPISEHKVAMERDMESFNERDEHVAFVPSDGGEDLYEEFILDWDVWCRMGKPTRIDVTVAVAEPTVGHAVL